MEYQRKMRDIDKEIGEGSERERKREEENRKKNKKIK